jgi:hypothetical protein
MYLLGTDFDRTNLSRRTPAQVVATLPVPPPAGQT